MRKEELRAVTIRARGQDEHCRLFILFDNNKCKLILNYGGHLFESNSQGFTLALEHLLEQLPEGAKITFVHDIFIKKGLKEEFLTIKEEVGLEYVPGSHTLLIKFDLFTNYEDRLINVSSYEDFGIAFSKLKDELTVKIETCAYCLNGDFKSDGGEDLRHGWYCFRDIKDIDLSEPWFDRLEQFEIAIPNMSAFYWCPAFTHKNKTFA